MRFLCLVVVCLFAQSNCQTQDPEILDYCRKCLENRWNHLQYYEYQVPGDCTKYFHCGIDEHGLIVSTQKECEPGTRWRQELLTCVIEYKIGSCFDPCHDDPAIVINGFHTDPNGEYGPLGCRGFYQCNRGVSHMFCCPEGSVWNAAFGRCDENLERCDDNCTVPMPNDFPITKPTAEMITGGEVDECKDVHGNFMRLGSSATTFELWVLHEWVEKDCPKGTEFVLDWCVCCEFTDVAPTMDMNEEDCLDLEWGQIMGDVSAVDDGFEYTHRYKLPATFTVVGGSFELPQTMTNDFFCLMYQNITFTVAAGGTYPQQLLSNCDIDGGVSRSIELVAEDEAVVTIVTLQQTYTVNLNLAAPGVANVIHVKFDCSNGLKAWAEFDDVVQSVPHIHLNAPIFTQDHIKIQHCPDTLGSGQSANNFIGSVAEYALCRTFVSAPLTPPS